MGLTQKIIATYAKSRSKINVETAVKLLEITGAGVNAEERANINKELNRFGHIKFKDAINRNRGLLAVTENGVELTRYWEEGRVTIDLRSETVDFGALWYWEPDEYRKDYLEEDDDWDFESLPKCDIDFSNISFDKFDEVISFIDDHADGVQSDGQFICWIV